MGSVPTTVKDFKHGPILVNTDGYIDRNVFIRGSLGVLGKLHLTASGGAESASGLLMGIGTSGDPATTATADAKFVEIRAQSTAASGDNRLAYLRYDLNGGGGGECLRAFTKVTAALGTARGAHISLDLDAAGSVTGLGVGVDMQLLVNDALPAGGNYFAGQAEMYFVSSASIAAVTEHAIFSLKAAGDATALQTCKTVLAISGSVGSGEMIVLGATLGTATGGFKCRIETGSGYVDGWIPFYTAEPS